VQASTQKVFFGETFPFLVLLNVQSIPCLKKISAGVERDPPLIT